MAAGATINVANLGEAQIHDAIVAIIEATDNFGESKQKLHTAYLTTLFLVLVIKYTISSICESRFTDIQSRASGATTAFHVYDDVWGVVYQDDKGKRSNKLAIILRDCISFCTPAKLMRITTASSQRLTVCLTSKAKCLRSTRRFLS